MTDDDIRHACRLAQRGDREARKLIDKLAESTHARAVILDFLLDPHKKRGMLEGQVTSKGEWHRAVLEEMEGFIEQARAEGCKQPVYEGAMRAAEWANGGSKNAEDYAPDDPNREGLGLARMGWGVTAEQLLHARRRGKKRGG